MSVVEVLIALGIAGIVIVSVGSSLASSHKLDTSSAMKEKALAYAKQSMEVIDDIQNNEFACKCTNPTCSNCSCTPLPNYTSCWTQFPDSLDSNSPLYLDTSRKLQKGTDNPENIFTRQIVIENLDSDGRFNRKKITVTVCKSRVNPTAGTYFTCEEQELQFSEKPLVALSTILTAWKNLQ